MWKHTQANHLLSLCPRSASRPRTTLPRWNLHSIFFLYAGFHPKVVLERRHRWVWGPHGKSRGAFFTSRSTAIVGYKKLWSRIQSRVEVSFPTNPSLKCILLLKTPPRKYNSCSRAFGRETHFWPTSNWRAVLLKRIQAPGQCAEYFTGQLCSEWPFTLCAVRTNHCIGSQESAW